MSGCFRRLNLKDEEAGIYRFREKGSNIGRKAVLDEYNWETES